MLGSAGISAEVAVLRNLLNSSPEELHLLTREPASLVKLPRAAFKIAVMEHNVFDLYLTLVAATAIKERASRAEAYTATVTDASVRVTGR